MALATTFRNYKAEPTIWKWLNSKRARTLCVGPVGSGKSSGFALKCFMIAARVMKDPTDGIRKSVIGVTRNTEGDLLKTVIPTFKKWFPENGKSIKYYKTSSNLKLMLDINTTDGRIQSTIWFIPLDKLGDMRKLLSLEVTAYGFDEFREIMPEIFEKAITRVGRFPPTVREGGKKDGKIIYGPYDDHGNDIKEVFAVSNCPNEGTYYGNLLLTPDEETEVFWQPGGKDPNAENLANLPEGYYDTMIEANKNNQNLINVDVHAKLGQDRGGLPVYQGFIQDVHVSKEFLKPTTGCPVIVGMDFATNPSAIFMQQMPDGQLRVLHELVGVNMVLNAFLENIFLPLRTKEYLGCDMIIFGDPSGVNRKDTDGDTSFKMLRRHGLKAQSAETNNILARISSVEQLFSKTVQGNKPKILFNKNLKWLIAGCRGGYKYKKAKKKDDSGMAADKPDKGMYSHAQDALQYACLYWNNPIGRIQKKSTYTPYAGEITKWGGY